MVQLAEPETIPASVEATINYHRDTGETPYTFTGGPGSLDIRSSAVPDPHRVVMHNGRLSTNKAKAANQGNRYTPSTARAARDIPHHDKRLTPYPGFQDFPHPDEF